MKRHVALILAVVFQLGVLGWEYMSSVVPLVTGERVLLVVHPVDPRSWFSGNYADLAYEVATIEPSLYRGSERFLREGEVVYVSLAKYGNVWEASELSLEAPRSGPFLRGRLMGRWYGAEAFRVRYGIEAYFAPKEQALAIERAVRDAPRGEVKAEVSVTSSGKAALVGLELPQ